MIISYIGYTSIEIPVKGQSEINVTLKEDSQAIEEVVVVGYGTQKKVNLVGAVAAVNIDEKISSRSISNVSSGLSGLVPGLQVSQTTSMAGNDNASLMIRGMGTVNNTSPLVVVDGMPDVDINRINMADVESISVLKDAASASIYGSRAANGAATDAALLQQIVVGAVNLSFTVLAIFTVDRFGRRPLMIIGALVMAVSMMILGTTFYTHSVGIGSLVCMLVYTAGFAMSWGPVCWVLLAEIFPNTIRSTVMSIAVAGQWIANFLVSWTFPMLDKNQYLTDTFNHGMAYWVYGVMGVLAALFIWKFVPETKGRTLEQMEQYWK